MRWIVTVWLAGWGVAWAEEPADVEDEGVEDEGPFDVVPVGSVVPEGPPARRYEGWVEREVSPSPRPLRASWTGASGYCEGPIVGTVAGEELLDRLPGGPRSISAIAQLALGVQYGKVAGDAPEIYLDGTRVGGPMGGAAALRDAPNGAQPGLVDLSGAPAPRLPGPLGVLSVLR